MTNPKWNNWLLVLAVVVLTVAPLVLIKGAEFGGADGQAEEAIKEIQPQYNAGGAIMERLQALQRCN